MPRILLLEDNVFTASDLVDRLQRAGFKVIGPAASPEDAIALLGEAGCDAAILDFQLQLSDSIARELQARKVPYVTVAAYSHRDCAPSFGSPMFSKPAPIAALLAECQRLKAGRNVSGVLASTQGAREQEVRRRM
jgi:CheY-like chemotaxis protein